MMWLNSNNLIVNFGLCIGIGGNSLRRRQWFLVYATLVGAIIVPMAFMWLAADLTLNIRTGLVFLFMLGIVVGLTIPGVLISWLVIGLTTIGSAFLLLGYVVMPTQAKILLLFAFPIESALVNLIRQYLFLWLGFQQRKEALQRYVSHYNPIVDLQTDYNAAKVYQKECRQIEENPELPLFFYVTSIHWSRNREYHYFNPHSHMDILRSISQVLKRMRLASEGIYYAGDATFLIYSYRLNEAEIETLMQKTKSALNADPLIHRTNGLVRLKWGIQRIDKTNVSKLSSFKQVMHRLQRQMETDLIVEYLKEED
mgnify:CR=1 FL=1